MKWNGKSHLIIFNLQHMHEIIIEYAATFQLNEFLTYILLYDAFKWESRSNVFSSILAAAAAYSGIIKFKIVFLTCAKEKVKTNYS